MTWDQTQDPLNESHIKITSAHPPTHTQQNPHLMFLDFKFSHLAPHFKDVKSITSTLHLLDLKIFLSLLFKSTALTIHITKWFHLPCLILN
jgi:hypothetical protein